MNHPVGEDQNGEWFGFSHVICFLSVISMH